MVVIFCYKCEVVGWRIEKHVARVYETFIKHLQVYIVAIVAAIVVEVVDLYYAVKSIMVNFY